MAEAGACPDENQLSQLVEGRLSGGELALVEAHVDACPLCASLLADLAAVLAPASGRAPVETSERFRITGELGTGAMGVVHAAFDTRLARRVALKRIRPDLGVVNPAAARDARARLLREARLLGGLSHPNVVALHDVEVEGDDIVLVQELVEGSTLDAWLTRESPSTRAIVDVFVQAARGLNAAHAAGLVHRDVKPSNLLVDTTGRARVSDFGLARLVTRPEAHAPGMSTLTVTGALVGTPAYMAPEQLMGRAADARSDQYALAVALVEALTGERPLPGSTAEDVEASAEKSGRAAPDRGLVATACRALQPRAADRWPDMAAFADAMNETPARATTVRPLAARPEPSSRRRIGAWLIGVAALGAAGAVVYQLRPSVNAASPASASTRDDPAPVVSVAPDLDSPSATATVSASTDLPAAAGTMPRGSVRVPAVGSVLAAATSGFDSDATISSMVGARRARDSSDGATCLTKLDQLAGTDPARVQRADAVVLRGECEMLAGRCDAGRGRIRSILASSYQGDDLAAAVDAMSPPRCKSPQAEAVRASVTLEQAQALMADANAAGKKQDVAECRKVAARAAALSKPGIDSGVQGLLTGISHGMTACIAGSGDCDTARKNFVALYPRMYPALVANGLDEAKRAQMFLETYPACAKP